MSPAKAWKVLGISPTTDQGMIRRAYAEKLKASDPDSDLAGFAALRDARDMALGYARSAAARLASTDSTEFDPQPEQPAEPQTEIRMESGWPHAAPVLNAVREDLPAIGVKPGDASASLPPINPSFVPSGENAQSAVLEGDPFLVPVLADEAAGDRAGLVIHAGNPGQRLWELLHGGDEDNLVPFSPGELAEAQAALDRVIADAEHGNLELHGNIENWLAQLLAGTWPRCAPLLGRASDYFGWTREAGQLGERPAIAYLNDRLRGLRFSEKVQLPDHPLHKAWIELSKPGRRTMLSKWQASAKDVKALLDGIRKNFPEVESYLDAERVASWESGGASGSSSEFSWRLVWFGIIILIQIVRFAGSDHSSPDSTALPQSATPEQVFSEPGSQLDPPDERPIVEQAVKEAFGGGTIDRVASLNSELASVIKSNVHMDKMDGKTVAESVTRIVSIIRQRALEAARDNGGSDLDSAMHVRLGLLRAARQHSVAACIDYLKLNKFDPSIVVPPKVIKADQELSNALLSNGMLLRPVSLKPWSARVPGPLVEQIMKQTGLSESRVAATMQNKGSEADKCAVIEALLSVTLDYSGKERTSILRTL